METSGSKTSTRLGQLKKTIAMTKIKFQIFSLYSFFYENKYKTFYLIPTLIFEIDSELNGYPDYENNGYIRGNIYSLKLNFLVFEIGLLIQISKK